MSPFISKSTIGTWMFARVIVKSCVLYQPSRMMVSVTFVPIGPADDVHRLINRHGIRRTSIDGDDDILRFESRGFRRRSRERRHDRDLVLRIRAELRTDTAEISRYGPAGIAGYPPG